VFDDHTTAQLLEIRSLCTEALKRGSTKEDTEAALLLLRYIDAELALRQERKAA